MSLLSVALSSFSLVSVVRGHSWVECTDYDMSIDIDASDFDNTFYHDSCSGYARDRNMWVNHVWAANSGIDYEIGEDGTAMCETSIGSPDNAYSDSYDSTYPMANYVVGDMKRLIWPAKNHADYDCHEGGDQLDNKMQLWVNLQPNATSDLGSDPDQDGWTLVIDWHEDSGRDFQLASCTDGDCNVQSFIGIDGVPFQNCPKFCDDQDGSVCYGDFQVPDIFPSDAYYTFVWYWEFKSNEIYSHCFEAWVSGTDAASSSNGGGSGSSSAESEDSTASTAAVLWSIFAFVIVFALVLMTCLVLKKNEYIVCTENSIVWNGLAGANNTALAKSQTNSQVMHMNDVTTSSPDGNSSTTGVTGTTEQPVPPPVPTVR